MNGNAKFLIGAAAGIAVGLLLAPRKGKELRDDITDQADKLKNKFEKLLGKANGNLEDLKTYLNKNIEGLTDDVKQKLIEMLNEAEQSAHAAKRYVKNGAV
ncbi:MAG TPA: YtxH domain-containing protein [Flavipsychrobacter sp.]|nr:YtxH domain-containing protein [Flavipsychrobacter sp.]